ncbi:hypothetical protein KHA80_12715 [Anaerobacillus sp. HL2]|nr:hypothetical protein KHA80_12715 [Anaerobacillus sp. HL2]
MAFFNEISLYTTVIIGHFDSFITTKKAGYELLPPLEVMINDEVLQLEENHFTRW